MPKTPNFEKVSVSLPPEVHAWLKKEAQQRTLKYGEKWTASRIIQESLREYRSRLTASTITGQAMPDRLILNEDNPPQSGDVVIRPATSAGGSSTAPTNYREKRPGK